MTEFFNYKDFETVVFLQAGKQRGPSEQMRPEGYGDLKSCPDFSKKLLLFGFPTTSDSLRVKEKHVLLKYL